MPDEFLREFGRQLRVVRTSDGLTLTQVAYEVLGNQERKGYVSKVENGNQRITALTIQKFVRRFPSLQPYASNLMGTPLPSEDEPDELDVQAAALIAANEDLAKRLKISESLVIALAYKYAEGSYADFDGALRGVEYALEVAALQARNSKPTARAEPSLETTLDELDALNVQGKVDRALDVAKQALARHRKAAEEASRRTEILMQRVMTQAVIARAAPDVAEVMVATAPEGADKFIFIRDHSIQLFKAGRATGVNFHLEVAMVLSEMAFDLAKDDEERATALNDKAICLKSIGERASGIEKLIEAVDLYEHSMSLSMGKEYEINRSITMSNAAAALEIAAQKSGDASLYKRALQYCRDALTIQSKDRCPREWARTLHNLGHILLVSHRDSRQVLEEASEAFRKSLSVRTKEKDPFEWALTNQSLGVAMMHKGKSDAHIDTLVSALGELIVSSITFRESDHPLYEARTDAEIGQCYVFLFAKTGEEQYRVAARDSLSRAAAFFRSIKSDWELAWVTESLDRIR